MANAIEALSTYTSEKLGAGLSLDDALTLLITLKIQFVYGKFLVEIPNAHNIVVLTDNHCMVALDKLSTSATKQVRDASWGHFVVSSIKVVDD